MERFSLGKTVGGLLSLLLCISGGALLFIPHPSPLATGAVVLLASLGALYWFITGLKQGSEQHSAWYKRPGVLVGLGYLLLLPECWLITTPSLNVPTLKVTAEVVLFLLIFCLFLVAGSAWRKSEPGPVDRPGESFFSQKGPPFRYLYVSNGRKIPV